MNKFEEALAAVKDQVEFNQTETAEEMAKHAETILCCINLASRIEPFREQLQKLEDIAEGVQTMANSIRTDVKMAYHMDGVELPSINKTLNRIDAELNLARPLFKAILGDV